MTWTPGYPGTFDFAIAGGDGDDDDDDDDGCVVSDRNGYCGRGRSGNKNGTASEESGRRRKVTMEDTIQKW